MKISSKVFFVIFTCSKPFRINKKIDSKPGETVETFFHERMASCFGHQPLTIARGRGGKYPSQREQWQLHGEVGDR